VVIWYRTIALWPVSSDNCFQRLVSNHSSCRASSQLNTAFGWNSNSFLELYIIIIMQVLHSCSPVHDFNLTVCTFQISFLGPNPFTSIIWVDRLLTDSLSLTSVTAPDSEQHHNHLWQLQFVVYLNDDSFVSECHQCDRDFHHSDVRTNLRILGCENILFWWREIHHRINPQYLLFCSESGQARFEQEYHTGSPIFVSIGKCVISGWFSATSIQFDHVYSNWIKCILW
jgi:hypothetical protein